MPEISRRRLFQLSGLGAVASFGLQIEGGLLGSASAVNRWDRFQLSNSSKALLVANDVAYPVKTGVHTTPQCFGFASDNSALYVSQKTLLSKTDDDAVGNIVVSRFPARGTGTPVQMKLKHAGHGGGIAVELTPDGTYLWVECDGGPAENGGGEGYGLGVTRIKFFQTQTKPGVDDRPDLSGPDPTRPLYIPKYPNLAPVYPGWERPRAYIDQRFDQLALKYRKTGENARIRIVVYDMNQVRRTNDSTVVNDLNTLSPILDREILTIGGTGLAPVQGFCVYGDFAYVLQGADRELDPNKNTMLRCYDLTDLTGGIVQETKLTIWKDLGNREPEGLCVKMAGSDGLGDRLAFGIVGPPDDYWYWLGAKDGYV